MVRRYGECKFVLDAVVKDLGVVREGISTTRTSIGRVETRSMTRNRSGAERRRWLSEVEERIRALGTYRAAGERDKKMGEAEEDALPPLTPTMKMSRREEPFQERQKENRHHEGVEYAAAAGEKLFHPGVPPPPRGRLPEGLPFAERSDYLQSQSARREAQRVQPTPRVDALPTKQSVASLTTAGTDKIFGGVRYMTWGKCYFVRAMVERFSREEIKVSEKSEGKMRSRSPDGRFPSSKDNRKAGITTSGLPAEITAGFFSNDVEKNAEKGEKTLWGRIRKSKVAEKIAPWMLDAEMEKMKANRHVGCAPGPSSRTGNLDNPFEPEKSFCPCCSPQLDRPKGVVAPASSTGKVPGKVSVSVEEYVKSSNSSTSDSYKSFPASVSSAKQSPRNPPNHPRKYDTFPPRRSGRPCSALPRTPEYGAMKPLASQLPDILSLETCSQDSLSSLPPLKLDNVVIDDQEIWMECSERLNHVSNIAAMEAWAKISHNRSSTASERRRNVPSVEIMGTATAEAVQMKKVRVRDVECAAVGSRKPSPPERCTHAPKQNSSQESDAAVQELDEVIQELNAVASMVRRPLNTPWEGAWHRDRPRMLRERAKTLSGYSLAESVPYSIRQAIREVDELEMAMKESEGRYLSSAAPNPPMLHPSPTLQHQAPTYHSAAAVRSTHQSSKTYIPTCSTSRPGHIQPFSPSRKLPPLKQPIPTKPYRRSTFAILNKKSPDMGNYLAQALNSSSLSTSGSDSDESWETADELYHGPSEPLEKVQEVTPPRRKAVRFTDAKSIASMKGIVESALERGDSALGKDVTDTGEDGASGDKVATP